MKEVVTSGGEGSRLEGTRRSLLESSGNRDFNLGGSYMEVNISKLYLKQTKKRKQKIYSVEIHFKVNYFLEQICNEFLSFFISILHFTGLCAFVTCFHMGDWRISMYRLFHFILTITMGGAKDQPLLLHFYK